MITDIATNRCLRAAEEMLVTERNLRIQMDAVETVCRNLRAIGNDSLAVTAGKLENTAASIANRAGAARTLSMTLGKIAGLYTRTETETADYGEEVRQIRAAGFRRLDLRDIFSKVSGRFEEF